MAFMAWSSKHSERFLFIISEEYMLRYNCCHEQSWPLALKISSGRYVQAWLGVSE